MKKVVVTYTLHSQEEYEIIKTAIDYARLFSVVIVSLEIYKGALRVTVELDERYLHLIDTAFKCCI